MRPDPRVDSILRWRYAIIAKDLRASAQRTDDQRKADDLRMMADYYDCLAATPEVGSVFGEICDFYAVDTPPSVFRYMARDPVFLRSY